MRGMASIIPMSTKSTSATIQPIIQVKIIFPVENSKVCLTAANMVSRFQTQTAKEITPPKIGIKLKISNTPGELAKPIVLKSSP